MRPLTVQAQKTTTVPQLVIAAATVMLVNIVVSVGLAFVLAAIASIDLDFRELVAAGLVLYLVSE